MPHHAAAESLALENPVAAGYNEDTALDNADNTYTMPDFGFGALGGEFLDWADSDLDFTNILTPQMSEKSVQYPFAAMSSPSAQHSTSIPGRTIHIQQTMLSPIPSIPSIPSSLIYAPRSLIERPLRNGAQRTANLVFHTLKSYPLMMLRDNALPPFIHPSLLSLQSENNQMEPLTNCISLVHMIKSRVPGSRKLFWKNVRMECERLCVEVR